MFKPPRIPDIERMDDEQAKRAVKDWMNSFTREVSLEFEKIRKELRQNDEG